ncbi:Ca2+-binding EF-hand superfamily protein [Povalibacter uvarum]|uniref:Ca2+-binding EF-hand superfamily protein n=1 Tax=Povalibacter uvarum TaxID=732238 RepID=A0A841HWS5_9GAMM|nr:hypothetical protein [Povalibacter uvarum]MBB6096235.1 Ca2+-binding EF-hand superfamily protein [Povalibacter uvarum]
MISSKGKVSLTAACAFAVSLSAWAGGDKHDKMAMMDTDGDGKITQAEHAAGAKNMFVKLDANADGKVTAAEMDAAHKSMGHDKAGKGMSSADKIAKLDTDGDGALSSEEHSAGSKKMFGRMDADGDGNLTAAEWKAGHDKEMRTASDY